MKRKQESRIRAQQMKFLQKVKGSTIEDVEMKKNQKLTEVFNLNEIK